MTRYDVARYLAIDEVSDPVVTPDGQLLLLADTTGTPQVWTTDDAGAWPRRLTPHEERVSTLAASPTDEAFVFGMDQGSDEQDQLFYYDLSDGTHRRLTDDPTSNHAFGAWFPDGERIAFTANRAATDRFDVYVSDVTAAGSAATQTQSSTGTPSPTRVATGQGGWLHVAAVSPDGERLALLAPNASFDVSVSVLDVTTGDRRQLAADRTARFSHLAFDGENGLYCVTDYAADTAYVGRIELDTGDVTPVAAHTTADGGPTTDAWSVDELAYDADTGRAAYTVNENGYSTLHAATFDGATATHATAPDPDGVVTDLTITSGGDRVAFTHTAPTEPYGVQVAPWDESAGGVGSATAWTPVGRCGLPDSAFRAPETVSYETFDGRTIPAYWTLPADADRETAGSDADDGVPVIVDIHGGPEHQRRPWFIPTKQFFLNRGYAVFEPNVRGSSGYGNEYSHADDMEKRLDSVADIAAAVEWLTNRPTVDGDRLVAYGRSYGGFMVLSAITEYPELWAAAVEFVGIADFTTFLENTGEWRRSHREAEYGSLDDDYDLLKEISPLSNIDRVQCPLFVQHGANDPRVPVSEAEQVIERAREAGVPVESLIFENEGHHTTDRANRIEEFERIADFLAEHV